MSLLLPSISCAIFSCQLNVEVNRPSGPIHSPRGWLAPIPDASVGKLKHALHRASVRPAQLTLGLGPQSETVEVLQGTVSSIVSNKMETVEIFYHHQ